MKINPEQIERLYRFTREHFVEFYDLQTELVDHLANSIEQQWAENPKLSFEDALKIEFKKFGVFGFMDVVEKRQAAMSKKYNKLVWYHFKGFFKVPQIILTAGLMIGLFALVKLVYFNYFFSILFVILFTFLFVHLYKTQKKIKKTKKETGKIWMFEQMLMGHGSVAGIISLPIQFSNIFVRNENNIWIENNYLLAVVCFIVISYYLTIYIITIVIPSKAEEYLIATYPEYKMAQSE